MQPSRLRTAATLVLISAALATTALTPAALAQRRFQGGGAPAMHMAPPAPHFTAPATHFAAPVHMAPSVHFAPATRFAAPIRVAPRIATPHVTAPHIATQQVLRRNFNLTHQNINIAHHNVTATPRHIESTTSLAHRSTPANPNAPSTGNANLTRAGKITSAPSVVLGEHGRKVAVGSYEQARRQIYAIGHKAVLHNQSVAQLARRDPGARALAHEKFRGRLAELQGFRDHDRDRDRDRFEERRRFRGIVIGWVGPVFWPYAYEDFVDYTFYPYATDTFWPYAYDDVYDGIFGGYAPDWSAYASAPAAVRARPQVTTETRRRLAAVGLPTTGAVEVCSAQAPALTGWPIEQIAQQIQPDDIQRALLEQLKDAAAQAVNLLQSACPTDLPSTPTGRLTEMHQRIQTMLQAVQLVRPVVERLYLSLSDEQKERFNALDLANSTAAQTTRSSTRQPDLTRVCSARPTQTTSLPSDRITQILQLDDAQRAALEQVKTASAKAADILNQNCPQEQSLTPTGRLAAMEQRLNAMLQAIDTVQPALAQFYGLLSDEQKARFNRLPRQA